MPTTPPAAEHTWRRPRLPRQLLADRAYDARGLRDWPAERAGRGGDNMS